MAAARASWGSVLSVQPASSSRTRADSVGGTSSTVSPAATSCCASSAPSPEADSMAHVRGVKSAANSSSRSRWRRSAPTRSSPMTVSVRSSTAAVWDPLWGSIPMMNTCPPRGSASGDATAGTPDEGRLLAPVSSHTAARTRPSGHFALKPTNNGGQGILETARRALGSYDHPQLHALSQPSGQYALHDPWRWRVGERWKGGGDGGWSEP